jgi:hypothetical protein
VGSPIRESSVPVTSSAARRDTGYASCRDVAVVRRPSLRAGSTRPADPGPLAAAHSRRPTPQPPFHMAVGRCTARPGAGTRLIGAHPVLLQNLVRGRTPIVCVPLECFHSNSHKRQDRRAGPRSHGIDSAPGPGGNDIEARQRDGGPQLGVSTANGAPIGRFRSVTNELGPLFAVQGRRPVPAQGRSRRRST